LGVNGLEGIGEAVTGGMAARAAEPSAGGAGASAGRGHTHETACLNCGAGLVGDFCHRCGQHAHVHRTLGAFGHDLLHGVLHLEGKLWRTLPRLMFRPGELTRRYIAGERARFVSPLAVFLFSVFLMFAVMGLLGSPLDMVDQAQRNTASAEFRREVAELEDKLETLRDQRAATAARGANTEAIDSDIREAEIASRILGEMKGDAQPAAKAAQDGGDDFKLTVGQGRVIGDKAENRLNTAYRAASKNPKLLIYKLQTNAYKFSWALIILSVPFVALLFLWRRRPLYDHTVFVTYSIAAVSILVIAGVLLVLAGVPAGPVWAISTLFVPWHMYRQLRGGYQLTRFSTLWRTFLLVQFATYALGLFAFGLLALGVLG
jgi:hypothetical protein